MTEISFNIEGVHMFNCSGVPQNNREQESQIIPQDATVIITIDEEKKTASIGCLHMGAYRGPSSGIIYQKCLNGRALPTDDFSWLNKPNCPYAMPAKIENKY